MAQVNLEIVLLRRFSHGFRRDVAPEVLHGNLAQLALFTQLSNRLIDGFQQARAVVRLAGRNRHKVLLAVVSSR